MSGAVLVDTNVFTAPLRNDRSLAVQYARHSFGRRIAVSPQTVAEARYGALRSGWGTRRLSELARLIGGVRVLPVDDETIERVAQLRNDCRLIGHALHQRHHNADLWIAGAAIRWSLPRVAHDSVFVGCSGAGSQDRARRLTRCGRDVLAASVGGAGASQRSHSVQLLKAVRPEEAARDARTLLLLPDRYHRAC